MAITVFSVLLLNREVFILYISKGRLLNEQGPFFKLLKQTFQKRKRRVQQNKDCQPKKSLFLSFELSCWSKHDKNEFDRFKRKTAQPLPWRVLVKKVTFWNKPGPNDALTIWHTNRSVIPWGVFFYISKGRVLENKFLFKLLKLRIQKRNSRVQQKKIPCVFPPFCSLFTCKSKHFKNEHHGFNKKYACRFCSVYLLKLSFQKRNSVVQQKKRWKPSRFSSPRAFTC